MYSFANTTLTFIATVLKLDLLLLPNFLREHLHWCDWRRGGAIGGAHLGRQSTMNKGQSDAASILFKKGRNFRSEDTTRNGGRGIFGQTLDTAKARRLKQRLGCYADASVCKNSTNVKYVQELYQRQIRDENITNVKYMYNSRRPAPLQAKYSLIPIHPDLETQE